MLRLLIDTSTLLDLAKRRDGQKWIVSLRVFAHQAKLELLVPTVVFDEFKRNRVRVETSMTASVSERFRLIKRDLDENGGEDQQHALDVLEGLAHQVRLIGAMTTRNFEDILSLLESGQSIEPTDQQRVRVVQRGLKRVRRFIDLATASQTPHSSRSTLRRSMPLPFGLTRTRSSRQTPRTSRVPRETNGSRILIWPPSSQTTGPRLAWVFRV